MSAASVDLAQAEAASAWDAAAVVALDAQVLELTKGVAVKDAPAGDINAILGELRGLRDDLSQSSAQHVRETALARERHAEGASLLAEIAAFVTAAATPKTKSGLPPLSRAARGQSLASGDTTHVLFVRLIAGGLDQSVSSKIGDGDWMALAGVTAEFAMVTPTGRLVDSGVRSALQSSTMKLSKPDSFWTRRLDYNEEFKRDPRL